MLAGYVVSFVLLARALGEGLGIGVAYGIWTAVGVALTAVLSKTPLRRTPDPHHGRSASLLIIAGVVLLELGHT